MSEQVSIKESILYSIKQALGIESDDPSFDIELAIHINSVLAILVQNGIGPVEGFSITGSDETWKDFIGEDKRLESVKSYVYLKVRIIFDPPSNTSVLEAFKKQADEFEWRNYIIKDIDRIEEEKQV